VRHETQHRVAVLRQLGVDERPSAVDQAPDVDPRPAAQRPPDDYRRVEDQRFDEQNQRHPLVEGDHSTRTVQVIDGHALVERQIVRIADPAEVVGVLLVVSGEVRRHPAVNGVADELFGRYDDGENDEQRRRVHVRQSVGEVVVEAAEQARQSGAENADDLVHLASRRGWRRRSLIGKDVRYIDKTGTVVCRL